MTLMYLPRRLAKYLSDSTSLSVEESAEAFAAGRVCVQWEAQSPQQGAELDSLIFEQDQVLLDGKHVTPRTREFVAMLNKPPATTSSSCEPGRGRDLRDWLRQMPDGTFPVGRLDRDTTGLLLFTTDGDLSSAILRPEHHTDKTYWLWLNEELTNDDPRIAALTCRTDQRYDGAKAARVVSLSPHYGEVELVLDQGKNRQIRRMCRALNLRLLHLHRKQVGPLRCDELAIGAFRELTDSELEALWSATGGRALARKRKAQALLARARERRDRGAADLRLEAWLSRCAEAALAER